MELKRPTTFITVTPCLVYILLSLFHTFSGVLRTQCAGSNVNDIELVSPYVDTDLDSHFREGMTELQGGKGHHPMSLQEYMEKVTQIMEKDGVKEVVVGFADIGVSTWRGAFDPVLEKLIWLVERYDLENDQEEKSCMWNIQIVSASCFVYSLGKCVG